LIYVSTPEGRGVSMAQLGICQRFYHADAVRDFVKLRRTDLFGSEMQQQCLLDVDEFGVKVIHLL